MSPRSFRLALAVLFALGLAVRLAYLDVPPFDFHPTRQYRSALIARAESPAALASLSGNERQAAIAAGGSQGEIEPEVLEGLAGFAYQLLGHEDLRAPRLFSILAWLMGTAALAWCLLLAQISRPWVLVGTAFTLLAPYGIDASRAFMPDPLMVGLILVTLGLCLRYHTAPTWPLALGRGLALAVAVGVKPMALCIVGPAVLALDVSRRGLWKGMQGTAVTCGAAVLPTVWYYMTLAQAGNNVAEGRFFVDLWTRPSFWLGWLDMLRRVIGWPAMILSAVGLVIGRGPLRVLLAATWVGYVALGLIFSHHISTHDYYSLPMLPLAGATIAMALHRWRDRGVLAPTAAAVGIGLVFVPQWTVAGLYGDVARARETAAAYEHIGALTQHSASVVSLDGAYGFPLEYHGRLVTRQLPLSIDLAINAGAGMSADASLAGGEYFVGTVQPELDAQPELRALLDRRHILMERGGTPEAWHYVVYDLKTPRLSGSVDRVAVFARADGEPTAAAIQILAPAGVAWRAVSANPARVNIAPDSGVGDTPVEIRALPGRPGAEDTVTIALLADQSQSPGGSITVDWRTLDRGPNTPPFGFVDAPADPIQLDGPVVVQGWALDDASMVRVDVVAVRADGSPVVIGTVIREGRRPDVAAAYPTAHDQTRAAWHFVLSGEALSAAGVPLHPGTTARIVFRAVDGNGAQTIIGERTVRRPGT